MTFNDIFFKKIYVNKIKLRHSRQKIVNDNCNFKKKCKRSVETHNIDELQNFYIFYDDQTIESKINEMIKVTRTIQIYNLKYFKKTITK